MYRKKDPEWLRHLDFELIDMVILVVTYLFVEWMRGQGDYAFSFSKGHVYFLICILDILIIFFFNPYKEIVQRGYWQEALTILWHFSLLNVFLIVCFYYEHLSYALPRLTMGIYYLLSMAIAYPLHLIRKWQIHRALRKRECKHMMLFTDAEHAVETFHALTRKLHREYRITAIALDERGMVVKEDYAADGVHTFNQLKKTDIQKKQEVADLKKQEPLLDGIDFIYGKKEAYEYLRRQVMDEVYLDRYDVWSHWHDTIDDLLAMGQVVHIGLAGLDVHYPNSFMRHFGDRYVITTTIKAASSWQLGLKRAMDIVGALVGLLITVICGIFIVPAIKIADPGPAFFSQIRISTNGRPFRFYKFRSMYVDAEARKAELMQQNQMQGFMFKMENDPRIIGSEKGPGKGLGNFLRSTSLDELPQFWNVLIGDMSLVGTRPPTQEEYEKYENRHKVRLSMKPGITGLWQISGRSDITDFEEVVRLDTEYIENWSIGMDLKILLKTVQVVFGKVGSR